jgi:hypothetical protein
LQIIYNYDWSGFAVNEEEGVWRPSSLATSLIIEVETWLRQLDSGRGVYCEFREGPFRAALEFLEQRRQSLFSSFTALKFECVGLSDQDASLDGMLH